MDEPMIDTDRIDEAVLALMYLTLHRESGPQPRSHAWKGFDWDALARLHEKELILDPVGKAKSVVLTEEGQKRCEEAFFRLFGREIDAQPARAPDAGESPRCLP